jgi:hypothetical protein
MATRIIEYAEVGLRGDAIPVVPTRRGYTEQSALTANGTSQQSLAVADTTRMVCVQSDEAVYLAFGTNPTATTNGYRLQAGGEQFFTVDVGKSWKVAVRT